MTHVAQVETVGFETETDVVVVGSGAAGFSAALAALRHGAEAILLEKAPTLGGTTLKSSVWSWHPNNRELRAAGHDDQKADALRYMARLSAPEDYDPSSPTLGLADWRHELLSTFYDHAADAQEALWEDGVHLSSLPDWPDYYSFLEEDKTPRGRSMRPSTEDGEPTSSADFIRECADSFTSRGGEIRTDCGVEQVVLDDDDAVVGVVALDAGRRIAIRARRGVIFASGGFAKNAALRKDFCAAPLLGTCAAIGCTGDFVEIATELGAPLRNMAHPWMTLMSLEQALSGDPDVRSLFHPPGDSMIWVNRYGDRTMNEKAPYNETAQMMQRWDIRRAEYPDLFQFMVWDEGTQQLHASEKPANPIRPAGEPAPHVIYGDTLELLAAAIAERVAQLAPRVPGLWVGEDFAARLRASVARFNEGAGRAEDPDFHRGETPIERYFDTMFSGGVRTEANPLIHPISTEGPYYATILVPGALDTKGGPMINGRAEVLGGDGVAIPGLYGAGNCVASPSGKSYWAGGGTIGPAITFGYLAGTNAAARVAVTARV